MPNANPKLKRKCEKTQSDKNKENSRTKIKKSVKANTKTKRETVKAWKGQG